MSITIGSLINENINDNRFRFNSFNNSNIIYLNTENNSYKDAIINFKDKYQFGFSNNSFVTNKGDLNLLYINNNGTYINNDIYIKQNLNTLSNYTYIHSNLIIKLYDFNNYFSIFNNNNKEVLKINSSNLIISYNNKQSLIANSNGILINDNFIMNSNNIIYTNFIKPTNPNLPVIIDFIEFINFNVINYNAKSSINIDNDFIYKNPSVLIKRYLNDCNIIDVYNRDLINYNNSNKIFTVNNTGFIGIGANNPLYPIDINLTSFNNPLIFNYSYPKTNDYFKITNRGYIGIGSGNFNVENQILININDDNRNIINKPVLNFNLNYNKINNYKTSNVFDLKFLAINEIIPILNNEDTIIRTEEYKYNNYTYNFTSNIYYTSFSENPFIIKSATFNIRNNIYNDIINNLAISNLIPINTCNYFTYNFKNFDIEYYINYSINIPKFINLDINLIYENGNLINPILDITNNIYTLQYTNYIYNNGTIKPYNPNNFILKEFNLNIYQSADVNIIIKQKLYIETGLFEFKNFIDTINFIYQPPANLIYATSNQTFVASLSADGKLALGDKAPTNDYQLYINKKSRIDTIEIFNISSIPNKNNVNFSFCNISNINKAFFNYNFCSNIIAETGKFNNININNIITDKINVKDISINELQFSKINNTNFIINSNFTNINMNCLIGYNTNNRPNSNFLLGINVNSNTTNGLVINSLFDNTNPTIAINSYGLNNIASFNINNYQLNTINNSFNFINNNRLIYKHNPNENLFIIGPSNNIIFDVKSVNNPDNTTNKIAFGYPYRYLLQNGYNLKNWENDFSRNVLNTNAMFNIYGNVNISSINNTPFINCIATNYPNEVINVAIGSNISRPGFIFNVEGNSYFASTVNVESNIFTKGTIGNVSDIRIKENLVKINNSLDKMDKINGYIYKRKDTGKLETGLIAQEVLEILPEVVNLDNSTNYYNISYGNMNGLLVEGIKELNIRLKKIEDLMIFYNSSNYP